MKWRHWSILIVLALLNYIIFSTAFTQLAEQRHPKPRPSRTPLPTFESVEPTPIAWIVLPTNTPRPSRTPVTPTPTIVATAERTTSGPAITAATDTPPPPTDTPAPATATPTAQTVTHTVKRGETLSEIAARYDVTVQAIVEANSLTNPSLIITGQKLIIPVAGQPAATVTPPARATSSPRPTAAKAPTPTPTSKPTPFQFTGQVVWDPLVAPNCSGPAISKQSIIQDADGQPVNGVRVEVECYGNKWLSHPSGSPGEYEPGHYDFAFGQTAPQDWTCTIRVAEYNGQPVTQSQVLTIHFDTNDCNPNGSGRQVAIVNWIKHW